MQNLDKNEQTSLIAKLEGSTFCAALTIWDKRDENQITDFPDLLLRGDLHHLSRCFLRDAFMKEPLNEDCLNLFAKRFFEKVQMELQFSSDRRDIMNLLCAGEENKKSLLKIYANLPELQYISSIKKK